MRGIVWFLLSSLVSLTTRLPRLNDFISTLTTNASIVIVLPFDSSDCSIEPRFVMQVTHEIESTAAMPAAVT